MQIKLTWHATGDYLVFDVLNNDLANWFVETSQRLGNCFSVGSMKYDELTQTVPTEELIAQEIDYIDTVIGALKRFRIPVELSVPTDWYSQQQLNALHKSWAQSRLALPKLTEFFYKIDPSLFEAYQEMNCHIHLIEKSFKYVFRDATHWRVDNPFKDIFVDWQVCHLHILYPGHGRTAFEKFQFYDDGSDIELDNINWDNIDAYVGLDLGGRPYKYEPPQEFLTWCNQKGLVPHGYQLPLANLHDYPTQLSRARQLATKNVTIPNNYFVLEIIE